MHDDLRRLARRDARTAINLERRDDRRMRALAERAALGRLKRRPLAADLGFGSEPVLVTLLGTGSVACRRIPVSVSCLAGTARKRNAPTGFKRTRWRNLKSVEAYVDLVGTT